MKHIAQLSTGGTLEIALPLIPAGAAYPAFWRMDQVGLLINLHQVVSISGAETDAGTPLPGQDHTGHGHSAIDRAIRECDAGKKLVALIDRHGDRWRPEGDGWSLTGQSRYPWTRAQIDKVYGIKEEVWE